MQSQSTSFGFTLIELMVVVAVIGILASIGVVSFKNVSARARDAKRIADLKAMADAIDIYHENSGLFPISDGWIDPGGSLNATLTPDYLERVPRDPKDNKFNNTKPTGEFGYLEFTGDTSRCNNSSQNGPLYILSTRLENPDRCPYQKTVTGPCKNWVAASHNCFLGTQK